MKQSTLSTSKGQCNPWLKAANDTKNGKIKPLHDSFSNNLNGKKTKSGRGKTTEEPPLGVETESSNNLGGNFDLRAHKMDKS